MSIDKAIAALDDIEAISNAIHLAAFASAGDPARQDDMKMYGTWSARLRAALAALRQPGDAQLLALHALESHRWHRQQRTVNAEIFDDLEKTIRAGLQSARTEALFAIGDKVDKLKGYRFPGTVVSIFPKLDGETRYVVEMDGFGLLHIYSAGDLVRREGEE